MMSVPSPLHRHGAEQAYLDSLFDAAPSSTSIGDDTAQTGSGHAVAETHDHHASLPAVANTAANTVTPVSTIIAQAQAGKAFACRLIRVAGLKLAVPETAIAQLLACPAGIGDADSVNSTALVAGRFNHGDATITVVNLRAMILPDATRASVATSAEVIVLLQDGGTGLLCDAVVEQFTVQPDSLCWRNATSRREWLAATARAEGFALLDTDGVIRLLAQAQA
jgi:hypothetical protein